MLESITGGIRLSARSGALSLCADVMAEVAFTVAKHGPLAIACVLRCPATSAVLLSAAGKVDRGWGWR
jgi:hypothetical protein